MTTLETFSNSVNIVVGLTALGVGKGIFNLVKSIKDIKDIKPMLENVQKELKPNGGTSLRDDVIKLNKGVEELRLSTAEISMMQKAEDITANFSVFRCNVNGERTFTNRQGCDILGMVLENTLGNGWKRAIHPEDKQRILESWDFHIKYGNDFIEEFRYLRPDKTVIKVQSHCVKLQSPKGEPLGFYGRCTIKE